MGPLIDRRGRRALPGRGERRRGRRRRGALRRQALAAARQLRRADHHPRAATNGRSCRRETFAPILYVIPVDSLDEAIAAQNAAAHGLSSALFTDRLQNAEAFLSARRQRLRHRQHQPRHLGRRDRRRVRRREGHRRRTRVGLATPGRPTCAARPTPSTGAASCRSRRASSSRSRRRACALTSASGPAAAARGARRPAPRCRSSGVRRTARPCRAPWRARGRDPARSRPRARRARARARRSSAEIPGPSSSTTTICSRSRGPASSSDGGPQPHAAAAPLAGVVEQVAQQLGEIAAIADELGIRARCQARSTGPCRRGPAAACRAAPRDLRHLDRRLPEQRPTGGGGALQLVLDDAAHAIDLGAQARG